MPQKVREIWSIKDFEVKGEKKSDWKKIGVAFENKDGSLNLMFNLFPTDPSMRIQVRDKREREEKHDIQY